MLWAIQTIFVKEIGCELRILPFRILRGSVVEV